MGRTRRQRWMAVLAVLPGLITAGCTQDNDFSAADESALVETIAEQVPAVVVDRVSADGDGFNYEYSISVHGRTTTDDRAEARSLARQVVRVVWHHAEASSKHISVDLALDDCTTRASCVKAGVDIPTDAARRLWGDAEHGRRINGSSGETFGITETDGVPSDWSAHSFVAYEPHLVYDVIVPWGTAEPDVRAGVDRIAAVLWREHPDRLTGISVNVISHSPTGKGPSQSRVLTYTANELRAQFGPRAADLDQ